MRERDREIKRRRKRYEKRTKLRKQLAAAASDSDRRAVENKIRKTYPKYTPEIV
jgi:hypothetical protein